MNGIQVGIEVTDCHVPNVSSHRERARANDTHVALELRGTIILLLIAMFITIRKIDISTAFLAELLSATYSLMVF